MPDYPLILQEFTWGYDDRLPDLIRTHKFLNHWKTNINAVISEVLLNVDGYGKRNWVGVDHDFKLN